MAISTSTLVFALATCVPFGLAIKDTLDAPPRHDDRYEYDRDYEAELKQMEERHRLEAAEQAAAEARSEAEAAAKQAKLRTLYGAEPATLGPAIGGVALGAGTPVATASSQLARIDTGMEVTTVGDNALIGLTIVPTSSPRSECRTLEDDLQQVWGTGEVGTRGRYWVNGALEQRAALKSLHTACELRIEKFTPPAAWIDRTKAAIVPLWVIGRPAKELRAHLASRPSVSGIDDADDVSQIAWTDLGLGPTGHGLTSITATLAQGKVVTVEASSEVEVDTFDATVAHMTKLFGAASDDTTMVWKHARPRLELEMSAGKLYLTAGKPPE